MLAPRPAARIAWGAVVLALSPAATAAPKVPEFSDGFPVTRPSEIYEVDEVRRGDRGIGYTVFAGDAVEPFEIEVLGLMEDMLGPDEPVILARLSGERIEFTGVIAGMSGSPVYIDGRLVGAVAYRFGSFTREPIAGITPIRSMLAARGSGRRRGRPVRSAAHLTAEAVHGIDTAWLDLSRISGSEGSDDLRPIATPVAVSRLAPVARERLADHLGSGWPVAAAPGHVAIGGPVANEAASVGGVTALPIAPASPIAALLVKGDLNIAAIGTVTYVDERQVLAFGHPFVGFGQVAFPMATAGILNTLASEAGSYKQGMAAREVGVVSDDRLTAIAGELGSAAETVPFVMRFTDAAGVTETTEVEIVADPFWLPIMLESVVSSAIEGRLDVELGGTVQAEIRIRLDDRALELDQTYSAPPPARITSIVGLDLGNLTAILARNDLAEPRFRSVELEVRFRPEVELVEVVRVLPARATALAGSPLPVDVHLRDYRGRVRVERVTLDVPYGLEGPAVIRAASGPDFDRRVEKELGRVEPTELDDLLGLIAERRPAHQLVVGLFTESEGLTLGAVRHPDPPPSWRPLFARDAARPVRSGKAALSAPVETPRSGVVTGEAAAEINIEPPRVRP